MFALLLEGNNLIGVEITFSCQPLIFKTVLHIVRSLTKHCCLVITAALIEKSLL